MTTPKGTDSRQRGKERKSSLASIVLPLILQPIPVTPERLAAAFSRAVHFSTLVLHHTVVITVPLCIWLVFSAFLVVPGSSSVCSSSLARLHRNLNLPDFIGQDLESWHMQTSSLLAACLLLFCLILAEKAMLTSAAAKVAAVRKSLRPEVLEMHYIGWQLPPVPSHHVGHGGSSSDEEGHHGELLQVDVFTMIIKIAPAVQLSWSLIMHEDRLMNAWLAIKCIPAEVSKTSSCGLWKRVWRQ